MARASRISLLEQGLLVTEKSAQTSCSFPVLLRQEDSDSEKHYGTDYEEEEPELLSQALPATSEWRLRGWLVCDGASLLGLAVGLGWRIRRW